MHAATILNLFSCFFVAASRFLSISFLSAILVACAECFSESTWPGGLLAIASALFNSDSISSSLEVKFADGLEDAMSTSAWSVAGVGELG